MPRRKRQVVLHMKENVPSVEGFFTGFWAGHYVIAQPKVRVAEGQTDSLESLDLVVPRENVAFMERLR